MSTDIGGLFGINADRRGIQSGERREIDRAVSNLLRNNRPFARPVEDNNSSGQPLSSNNGRSDSHSRSHSYTHTHNHGNRHRHAHGHRHGHNYKTKDGS
jgi:hypothetical protein